MSRFFAYLIIFLIIAMLVLISACTSRSDLSDKSRNQVHRCTDTRDGEEFTYNTNTITNVRAGWLGADSSFELTDMEGNKRYVQSSDTSWLKCKRIL